MTSDLSHILTTPKYNMTRKVRKTLPNVMYEEMYSVYKTFGIYDLQFPGFTLSILPALNRELCDE